MMSFEQLKRDVVDANRELPKQNLVKFSWGNVSAIDRESDRIVIKPVGIPYDILTVENICVVDREGNKLEGPLAPSVDTDIHRALYDYFPQCAAIVHTHSTYATVLAQMGYSLPCYGTTHADYFAGEIPCVAALTDDEIKSRYEWNTGMAIVKHFQTCGLNPAEIPAALSMSHGPFTWGTDVWDAVHKAVVLEQISKMAVMMLSVRPDQKPISKTLLDQHFYRKHGANAKFENDDYGHGMVKHT